MPRIDKMVYTFHCSHCEGEQVFEKMSEDQLPKVLRCVSIDSIDFDLCENCFSTVTPKQLIDAYETVMDE